MTSEKKRLKPDERLNRLFVGIPCYGEAPAKTLEDYCRFFYHMGRRHPEYEVFLGVIDKAEQFRARNRMIEAAMTVGAKYCLMLDDDMVIDTENNVKAVEAYDFVAKLAKHIEDDPEIGIVGALYYQRGGEYHPVAMFSPNPGEYMWMPDSYIKNELQEVDVAGGGCLLINMEVFDKVPSPWFEPEQQTTGPSRGTDVQICEKVKEAGYKVMLDTSIELGHVSSQRIVVTRKNRGKLKQKGIRYRDGIADEWDSAGMITMYCLDVEKYLDMTRPEIERLAEEYDEEMGMFGAYDDPVDYYKQLGNVQLARQYAFHSKPGYGATIFLSAMRDMLVDGSYRGLDFGCGSAPLGFELATRGHTMDFVDIDGAGAYEFLKWRCKERGIDCGWELGGPYDFILCLDSLEHVADIDGVLEDLVGRLVKGGVLVTNYFYLTDDQHPEHISCDRRAVRHKLLDLNMMPGNKFFWRKGEWDD